MPPLQPVLKRKVDELFLRWLSDPNTQRALHDSLRRIRDAPGSDDATRGGPGTSPDVTRHRPEPPDVICALPLACSRPVRTSCRSPGHRKVGAQDREPQGHACRRVHTCRNMYTHVHTCRHLYTHVHPVLICAHPVLTMIPNSQVQPPQEDPPPPASSCCIPTFYFPHGRPPETLDVDAVLSRIKRVFAEFPQERATVGDMGRVAKVGVGGAWEPREMPWHGTWDE